MIRAAAKLWALALTIMMVFAGAGSANSVCSPDRLHIRAPNQQNGDTDQPSGAAFSVELADTPDARAVGLMHREKLAASQSMLFVYEAPGAPAFWMRNTLIELDMLFIKPDGRVAHVHHRAKPHDETLIRGGTGILAVLEIQGGLAKTLKIRPGHLVRHPAFAAFDPIWPC